MLLKSSAIRVRQRAGRMTASVASISHDTPASHRTSRSARRFGVALIEAPANSFSRVRYDAPSLMVDGKSLRTNI